MQIFVTILNIKYLGENLPMSKQKNTNNWEEVIKLLNEHEGTIGDLQLKLTLLLQIKMIP